MERNAVLPKRWNGPLEREHLNSQRRSWSQVKQKDRDDKLAHYDEFTTELQKLSLQQAESLNLDKLLQGQIKMLRDNQEIDWKEKIKALQQQVEDEKEKRRGYKNRRQVINKSVQELKDNGLSGTRVNGRRPTHSANNMAVGLLGNEVTNMSGMLALARDVCIVEVRLHTDDNEPPSEPPFPEIQQTLGYLDKSYENIQGKNVFKNIPNYIH
jgi:hypothetical protein